MKGKSALQTLGFCSVVTVIIAAVLIFTDPRNWQMYLLESFVFSMAIGYSISYEMSLLTPWLSKMAMLVRLPLMFLMFLVGGTIGTLAGSIILVLVFGGQMYPWASILLFNLVLAAIFGSIAVIYFSLRGAAEKMAERLREKEIAEEKLEKLRAQAELAALQAKVNPHFLFNTLNSIASLIAENPQVAEATVEKLSGLFRYTLDRTGEAPVKLSEEIAIVRAYLEIEKVRFGDRLNFEIRADNRLDNLDVPALLVQPLVENSIKHAIAQEILGGSVLVETQLLDGRCVITVSDSGKGFSEETIASGFGLQSIRERLRLTYGEKATLTVGGEGQARTQISLPLGSNR